MIYNKTYYFTNELIKGLAYNSDMNSYQTEFYRNIINNITQQHKMKFNSGDITISVGMNIHLVLYRTKPKGHMAVPFSRIDGIDQMHIGMWCRDSKIYFNSNLKDGELIIGENLKDINNYIFKKGRKEKLNKLKK